MLILRALLCCVACWYWKMGRETWERKMSENWKGPYAGLPAWEKQLGRWGCNRKSWESKLL